MNGTRLPDLQRWVGRGEGRQDVLDARPAQRLAATLDLQAPCWPRTELPPLWHVLYFLDATPTEELADDGTPRDLPLLPPVEAGQMLWAGADYVFHKALALEAPTHRQSRVDAVSERPGALGPLVFVTLSHQYTQASQLCLTERVQLVFLQAGARPPGRARRLAPPCGREHHWPLHEALLFRFAALTFDTHRIHYDLAYATGVAGHPGLVVQGPLQALLMAELVRTRQPARPLRSARFRAHAPLCCLGGALRMGEGVDPTSARRLLWTEPTPGEMAVQGCFGY